jgi:DGQHR domain-containing protein
MGKKARRKRSKKPKLSAAEKLQAATKRDHIKLVRRIFAATDYTRLTKIADKEFKYLGSTSDFDDVFLFQNVLVLAEYTISQESNVAAHLKNKKILYDKILSDPSKFIVFLREKFPTLDHALKGSEFEPHHFRVRIVYCSRYQLKASTKDDVPEVKYLDYNVVRYFESVSRTVRKSARFELFQFLGLEPKDVGHRVIDPGSYPTTTYAGSVLPEGHSHFGTGFKVVSFYMDPEALLERCYVLRRYGWRVESLPYQRMISKKKVETVRKYLLDKNRVFVNNIIVTLPSETKLLDEDNETIKVNSITKTQPSRIQLPKQFNSIGIIDGQHRIFSYHEGGSHDDQIKKLRMQQNLLVTGIIFPRSYGDHDRAKFEATLFLEINSNQTNAKSELKQEIGLMLRPFAAESIAKRVVTSLNDGHGALSGEFERYFYDKDKIKTTSVVSYGIRPLVNFASEESLFRLWKHPNKKDLLSEENEDALTNYVEFCVAEINYIFAGAKARIPQERWTADRKVPKRFLTTTNINGLIGCLRRLVKAKALKPVPQYIMSFEDLANFNFSKYKSSQYNRMAEDLYQTYFA